MIIFVLPVCNISICNSHKCFVLACLQLKYSQKENKNHITKINIYKIIYSSLHNSYQHQFSHYIHLRDGTIKFVLPDLHEIIWDEQQLQGDKLPHLHKFSPSIPMKNQRGTPPPVECGVYPNVCYTGERKKTTLWHSSRKK